MELGMTLIRISKILSDHKVCSRREADSLIEKGLVLLNGEVAKLGDKASAFSEIKLLDEAKQILKKKITIILHKPLGYVSNLPQDNQKEAKLLLTPQNCNHSYSDNLPDDLSVAGRLDVNSSGLMVFTNDGTLAKKLIGERADIEKEYIVRVHGEITRDKLKQLRYGLILEGRKLKRAQVDVIDEQLLRIVLKEGMKRQIRKMCEAVDLDVVKLKRVRIGRVVLGKLPIGKWKKVSYKDF